MIITRTPFIEPYKNVHDLVQLLSKRGLNITNQQKAERYLSTIGYYRLSGDRFWMTNPTHFADATKFSNSLSSSMDACRDFAIRLRYKYLQQS